jgi:RNA polymerase sigma-70 factor (ECF subfamily)
MQRGLLSFHRAHDAALADVLTTSLKLWLDENECLTLPARPARCKSGQNCRKHQRGGDEAHVHREKTDRLRAERRELTGREQPCIGTLQQRDARIDAQLVGHLTVAGVDGENAGRAVLEQTVCKSSCRRADVRAGKARDGDAPGSESAFELEAAAADVTQVFAKHPYSYVLGHTCAGLVHALLIDQHATGEHQGLGALARLRQATLHQKFVEPLLGHVSRARITPLVSVKWAQKYRVHRIAPERLTYTTLRGKQSILPAKSFLCRGVLEPHATITPAAPNDDGQLLARIQRGDEQAMAVLYDRYSRVVYSVALRVLRDAASAEDILQEIFMQIWRHPDSFTATRGSFGGWLSVVARNRSIDALRRKRPTEQVEEVYLASPVNLADEAARNLMMERARLAILHLPPEQRKTLEMAFFDGLTHSEISEMTGDPLGTVKTRIRSALGSLRKAFQA